MELSNHEVPVMSTLAVWNASSLGSMTSSALLMGTGIVLNRPRNRRDVIPRAVNA